LFAIWLAGRSSVIRMAASLWYASGLR
jgi:hypothetical protein